MEQNKLKKGMMFAVPLTKELPWKIRDWQCKGSVMINKRYLRLPYILYRGASSGEVLQNVVSGKK